MSLPGKTMKIGGYNYHVSDQGEGDKVAMLIHGMPDDGIYMANDFKFFPSFFCQHQGGLDGG
jgi:hypothetical protein